MKPTYKNLFFLLFLLVLLLNASAAFAFALELEYPTLQPGVSITLTSDLSEYLKYVFHFGISAGFMALLLSLLWASVLFFLSPVIPDAISKAKDRVSGAISGMIILCLAYLIITTINPSLAIFKLGKLDAIEPPPKEETVFPGVSFYNSSDCSGEQKKYTASLPDLEPGLKNNVHSVAMTKDSASKTAYIAILYDSTNFWGKCQYVNPNNPCSSVAPFAASSSIHQYDFNPQGDGVYIYRKSLNNVKGKENNENGGYYHITNSEIGNSGIYIARLSSLSFVGVPEGEQDCTKYDKKGDCKERTPPKLDKENISSIYMAGNYLVLLLHVAPWDSPQGPWNYCQAYASIGDTNKDGPKNIKWDAIRSRQEDPNFIAVIPIKGGHENK